MKRPSSSAWWSSTCSERTTSQSRDYTVGLTAPGSAAAAPPSKHAPSKHAPSKQMLLASRRVGGRAW
eukprot:scaffold141227_cov115-Phaeocystis_antarctica.AAC.2